MKLVVASREPRSQEKRTLRGLLTLVFVVAGLAGGAFAARAYNELLKNPPYWLEPFQAGGQLSPAGQVLAVVGLSVAGALLGFLLSSMAYAQVLHTQTAVETMSAKEKLALFLGLVFGLVLTLLIALSLQTPVAVTVAVAVILCYLSVAATMSIKEQLRFYYPGGPVDQVEPEVPRQTPKLLDTNVIIDGRIVDICRTGFVEGPVFIPRFILDELQHIADSSDSLKRARGRRGLDILNQMRKELGIKITTYDPEGINLPAEVDSKLVTVAQHLEASIITNDFNLNKVAELQGVAVLNVNELANALKPVVLPGEPMNVTVIKGGKEANQGVAYLDDGTMVVIENAKRHIGERVDVIVASVWQTVAGKMIFASLKDEEPGEDIFPDAPAQARPISHRPRRR